MVTEQEEEEEELWKVDGDDFKIKDEKDDTYAEYWE